VLRAIVDVARTLFSKKGYSETSLSDIAKAMKFRKASLYYYFKSKDEILKHIFQMEHARGESVLESIPTDLDLKDTLYTIGTQHLKMFRDPKSVDFMRIMIGEGLKDGKIQERFFEMVGTVSPDEKLLKLIRAKAESSYTDKELLYRLILFRGSLFSHIFHTKVMAAKSPFKFDDEDFLNCLCSVYAKGL